MPISLKVLMSRRMARASRLRIWARSTWVSSPLESRPFSQKRPMRIAAEHFRAMNRVIALAHEAQGDAGHRTFFGGNTRSGFELGADAEELTIGAMGRCRGDFVDHALVTGSGGHSAGLFCLRFLGSDFQGGGVFVVCGF